MRQSVRENWIAFTESFEGGIPSPYLDIRGMATIAYGNLVDSAGAFSTLQLVHPDGTFATTSEKVACFANLKAHPELAQAGWQTAAKTTDLRLTKAGMADLAYRRLAANESAALIRLPEWETYPACAQMAMHSLFWACGPAAHFPKLFSAVMARDWAIAAIQIQMNEWTPEGKRNAGLIPRNAANRKLMMNAAKVDAYHLDPELLEWNSLIGVANADTVPDLSIHDEPTNPGTPSPVPLPDNSASSPTIHPFLSGLDPDDGNPPPEAA